MTDFEFAIAQKDSSEDSSVAHSTVIDLIDLTTHPETYDFFTFRPDLKKLILAGTPATAHISILWYTAPSGRVGRHYHAMTEAIYAISGSQTDAHGTYPTGSLYFNPPGSSHEISNSSGFFILAHAAPPDFTSTNKIRDYTPVHINTADPNLEDSHPFIEAQNGVRLYTVPLSPGGGITALLIKVSAQQSYRYTGNYLLVLQGRCSINGTTYNNKMLIVAKTTEPQSYQISIAEGHACLSLGLAFKRTGNQQ